MTSNKPTVSTVKSIHANGTSLKGYISASYEQLFDAFGDANYYRPNKNEKVQIEWTLRFEDGTIATIYDWKKWGYIPASDEVVEWNVGGHSLRALELVKESLNLF